MKRRLVLLLAAVAATSALAASVVGAAPSASVPDRFFDTTCTFSRYLNDDPIVYPGQPAASHTHAFFGNTTTDAYSTGDSMVAANADGLHTTCHDPLDGAGYWVPALFQDGHLLDPFKIHVYYKTTANLAYEHVETPPTGWRQVSHEYDWGCTGSTTHYREAPAVCSTSSHTLQVTIHFAQCWDGTNLYLPNSAHVAQRLGKNVGCPSGYPVDVPGINMIVMYRVDSLPHTYELALGADGTRGPTSTAHGDFMTAWNPDQFKHLIDTCLNTYTTHIAECNRR